jgi:hypothetical protein
MRQRRSRRRSERRHERGNSKKVLSPPDHVPMFPDRDEFNCPCLKL